MTKTILQIILHELGFYPQLIIVERIILLPGHFMPWFLPPDYFTKSTVHKKEAFNFPIEVLEDCNVAMKSVLKINNNSYSN